NRNCHQFVHQTRVVIEAPVTTGGREDTLTGKTNFSGMPQRRVARLSRANSPVAHQPPRSEGLEDRRLVVRVEARLPGIELTGCRRRPGWCRVNDGGGDAGLIRRETEPTIIVPLYLPYVIQDELGPCGPKCSEQPRPGQRLEGVDATCGTVGEDCKVADAGRWPASGDGVSRCGGVRGGDPVAPLYVACSQLRVLHGDHRLALFWTANWVLVGELSLRSR